MMLNEASVLAIWKSQRRGDQQAVGGIMPYYKDFAAAMALTFILNKGFVPGRHLFARISRYTSTKSTRIGQPMFPFVFKVRFQLVSGFSFPPAKIYFAYAIINDRLEINNVPDDPGRFPRSLQG